jgi:Tfp pilus assembly protein PilN
MHNQNIIDPKNLPLWTAAGFIVALVALIIALTGLYRSSTATVINQAHILLLNQKIDVLTQKLGKESISKKHPDK